MCLCVSWWHTSCSIQTSCWSCLTSVVSWRSRRYETVLARYSAAYQQVGTFVFGSSPGMPSCLQTRLSKLNWNLNWNNTFRFISPAFISSFFRLGWNPQRQPLGIIRAVFYRPDALPVIGPLVSNCWMKFRAVTPARKITHSRFSVPFLQCLVPNSELM